MQAQTEITKEDFLTINKIAKRATLMARELGCDDPEFFMTMSIDIEEVHKTNPLKLTALFEADDFNFAHDVFGIRRNMNRTTGKLENCFLPRYSA